MDGNGNVLKYFIEETNRRLERIEKALEDLRSFKAQMMLSSRIVAVATSAVVGVATSVLIKVILG